MPRSARNVGSKVWFAAVREGEECSLSVACHYHSIISRPDSDQLIPDHLKKSVGFVSGFIYDPK